MANNLNSRQVRKVYLITLSQASPDVSRQGFVDTVVRAFEIASTARVVQWACSQEFHANGGQHFHLSVKLDKTQRWLRIRNYLAQHDGLAVNFSALHHNYYSAWKYVTKTDLNYLQSPGHPDLDSSIAPTTDAASQAVVQISQEPFIADPVGNVGESTSSEGRGRGKRPPKLTSFDVSQLVVQKNLKTRLELVAYADRQKAEGKLDLLRFIVNRGKRVTEEAIQVGWEIAHSQETLQRSTMTRTEVLLDVAQHPEKCVCNGQWLQCALEILVNNGIDIQHFATSVYLLLLNGRGKYRNLMITGPANCGKTFMFQALSSIYKTFTNPATGTFAWVGAELDEVIFLNDFRWNSKVIPWNDLLLLLEGQPVHLPAPKTHYAHDITFDKSTPIFCTAKQPLVYITGTHIDERETEMMNVRWKTYSFSYQIPQSDQMEVKPCGYCFAHLVLDEKQ